MPVPKTVPYGPSTYGQPAVGQPRFNTDIKNPGPKGPYGINNLPGGYLAQYQNENNALKNDKSGKFIPSPPLAPNVAYALDQLLSGGFQGIQNAGQQAQNPSNYGFGQNQLQSLFGKTANTLQNQQGMSPELQQLLQQTLKGSQGNFDNIANQEINRFNTQTIPGLAERFQAMGGNGTGNSGAFQGALGQASNQLSQGLASLKEQYGLQEQGQRQNLLGNLLQQGNQQNALQQNLFGQLLGGGQQNQAQGLQLLQNMLTQGLSPKHEYGFQPSPPSFLGNVGQGLGQGTALAGAGLLKYLTGGLA